MDGTRAVAIALLVCLASFSGLSVGATETAQQDSGMSVVSAGETSEYLAASAESIQRTGGGTATLDVAGAVGANAGEVRVDYADASLQRAYLAAESDTERETVVRNGTEAVTDRVDDLERKERLAVDRFETGEISERELLRTLAVVHREAEATETSIEWLSNVADNQGMDAESDQLSSQEVRLIRLQSPLRASINDSLDGGETTDYYVESSENGLVIAAMEDTNQPTYLREADDPTARTVNIDDRYNGALQALDRIEALYPWTVGNNTGLSADAIGPPRVRVYQFQITHPHGELTTYLDGGSEEITHEFHRTDPEELPTTTVDTTGDDFRLQLDTTRAGGPLSIAAFDTATGDPVDADIEVNDRPVGSTGEEGLWTVAPRGAATINATYAGETVTAETTFS